MSLANCHKIVNKQKINMKNVTIQLPWKGGATTTTRELSSSLKIKNSALVIWA